MGTTWLFNVAHVLVILLAFSVPISLLDGSLFAWHPSLMALGFLGLMTEGILTSIRFRSTEGNERSRRIWVHFFWQVAAVSLIIGGFVVIYQNKVIHGKSHFSSLHGKFGLSTFILVFVAAAGGVSSFRKFGVITKLPDKQQPQVKWLHRNAGTLIWLLSLITIELALVHQAVWKETLSKSWQLGVAALGIVVAACAWQHSQETKQKLPVYEEALKYPIVTAADELTKTA